MMNDASTLRAVRLKQYLIEQGAGPGAQADIFFRIHSGALPAFLTVQADSPPAGANIVAVLRHAMNDKLPREVPVRSLPKVKAEIMNAALGRNPDWELLDRLILHVPTAMDRKTNKIEAKALTPAQRELVILKAIDDAGLGRYTLTKPMSGKRTGDRSKVWEKVPENSMGLKDFENSWLKMKKTGAIRFADDP